MRRDAAPRPPRAPRCQTWAQPRLFQSGSGQRGHDSQGPGDNPNRNCSTRLWGRSSPLGQCSLPSLCPSRSPAGAGGGQAARAGRAAGTGSHRIPPPSLALPSSLGKSGCGHWRRRAAGMGVGRSARPQFPCQGNPARARRTPPVPGGAGRRGKMRICSQCSCPVHPVSWSSGGAPQNPMCAVPRPPAQTRGEDPLTPPSPLSSGAGHGATTPTFITGEQIHHQK